MTSINAAGHNCSNFFNEFVMRVVQSDSTHHWFFCSDNAGTNACHDMGIVAADNTWYYIRMRRIDATTVGATIGTSFGTGSEYTGTSSADIPSGSGSNIVLYVTNRTAVANTLDMDYFEFVDTLTR